MCASIADVARWLDWSHAGYSRAESDAWIASRPDAWAQQAAYSFAVVYAVHDDLLGTCGLRQINPAHGVASMGYWVRSDRAGEGIATQAARLMARFGFETLGLRYITSKSYAAWESGKPARRREAWRSLRRAMSPSDCRVRRATERIAVWLAAIGLVASASPPGQEPLSGVQVTTPSKWGCAPWWRMV